MATGTPQPVARLGSLDAYRGFVMLLMMAEVLRLGDAAVVQHAVARIVRSAAADGCRIAVPNSGWVNSTALAYSLTRGGIRDVAIREEWACDDLARHREIFEWADVIVTSEPGTGLVDEHHPAGPLQPALLELAAAATGHVEIGRVPTAAGPAFHVFARREATALACRVNASGSADVPDRRRSDPKDDPPSSHPPEDEPHDQQGGGTQAHRREFGPPDGERPGAEMGEE